MTDSVVAKFATTAVDGKVYQVDYYNLDAIISVGYRVNSKRGTQFRQWAANLLKDYLIQGYAVNQKQLNQQSLHQLQQTIALMSDTLRQQNLVDEVGDSVLYIIQEYAKTWDLLLRYDENRFNTKEQRACRVRLRYEDSLVAIDTLKAELFQKNEHNTFLVRSEIMLLKLFWGILIKRLMACL